MKYKRDDYCFIIIIIHYFFLSFIIPFNWVNILKLQLMYLHKIAEQ
jgi:hypothetical protein